MKICIPSKSRAETMTTQTYFDPKDVLIFVEPSEIKRYQIFQPEYTIVNINENDRGIVYARNFILNYVKEDKLIMADDDIEFFGIRNKEYRYDRLFNPKEIIKEIENGLDSFCGYTIPRLNFAYFTNRQYNNEKRLFINNSILIAFYGLNRKKLKELDIAYDDELKEMEDLDLGAQIIIKGEKICSDYQYGINNQIRTLEGGMQIFRKTESASRDISLRKGMNYIGKKYGPEFISASHDKNGYIISMHFKFDLLGKRKGIFIR